MRRDNNKDYSGECRLAADRNQFAAREEVRLFGTILYGKNAIVDAWLVGDIATNRNGNPHGLANIGDHVFTMKEVHIVISNYSRLLELYGSNEGIAERVYAWANGFYGSIKSDLQTWLLGRKEPTNDDKQSAKEYIERLKQELYEEPEKYKQSKNGGF